MSVAIVMGLGRFGGGLGAVRHLVRRGSRVVVLDRASPESLAGPLGALKRLIIEGFVTIDHSEQRAEILDEPACRGAEIIVVNPAVPTPWSHPLVSEARSRGMRVTTEIDLLLDELDSSVRLVGVTGTAGKSTTASMIHAGLLNAGEPSHLGGNLGGSLLHALDTIAPGDTVVLELSSAMLYWLGLRQQARTFEVGVLTSFSPNHLDWHGSVEHYHDSKNVLAQLTTGTFVDATNLNWPTPADRVAPAASCPTDIQTIGEHNRLNACAALAACDALGTSDAWPGIAAFPGLPHRLCVIHESSNGIRFIDDSKSTTPESTALAISALDRPPRTVRLIAGGYDKGVELTPLVHAAADLARVYAIGATASALCRDLANSTESRTLEAAMVQIAHDAQPGESVLLSPGCASWDQFENFEARGELFAHLARKHFSAP